MWVNVFSAPMLLTARFLISSAALELLGCSGGVAPYAPAGGQPVPVAGGHSAAPALNQADAVTQPDAGLLDVSTGSVMSYFATIHGVVRDVDGQVVSGADSDSAGATGGDVADRLALVLPAAAGYTLDLSATTADTAPTTCTASIGPLDIEAGAIARVQVFAWRCGNVTGYVPSALNEAFSWLADWTYVERTSAAVGALIGLGAFGHDAAGNPARVTWSTDVGARGAFANPASPSTSFRCQAPGENVPLTVSISDGQHTQQITQSVTCF